MKKLLKISLVCVAGAFVLAANPKPVYAYEEGVAGFIFDKDSSSKSTSSEIATISLSSEETPIPGYNNIGIADVDKESNLLIRKGPGTDYKIVGKLPNNGGCEIIEEEDGWTKIKAKTASGSIEGYVKSSYLITGTAALKLAKEVGSYVATANTDGLNVRDKASTDSSIVDRIAKGEELIVLDSSVTTEDSEHGTWVKVSIDSDTEEGSVAYVAKEYVEISFQLIHAVTIEELQYGSGVSSRRVNLVNMAKDHLGEAYVWGGTTLGGGVDCSGFTQALYRKLGYSIPRTSRSQAASGTTISASQLKPGDLVFYGSSSYINHVAMYIGNGQVIHASNRRDGIKISNMYYRSPVKYVRYISD
jgi:uncharacterized protein YgiM (DUF1202 family)